MTGHASVFASFWPAELSFSRYRMHLHPSVACVSDGWDVAGQGDLAPCSPERAAVAQVFKDNSNQFETETFGLVVTYYDSWLLPF